MMLHTNVGPADRALRTVMAVALVGLAAPGFVTGGLAVAAYVVAVVLFATAVAGFCPLYRLLGIDTCPVPSSPKR